MKEKPQLLESFCTLLTPSMRSLIFLNFFLSVEINKRFSLQLQSKKKLLVNAITTKACANRVCEFSKPRTLFLDLESSSRGGEFRSAETNWRPKMRSS